MGAQGSGGSSSSSAVLGEGAGEDQESLGVISPSLEKFVIELNENHDIGKLD